MNLLPLSRKHSPPIEWLWPGYLPLGSLVLLDGDPGLGKSMITLDLAARLTAGRPFPTENASRENASREPGSVLLICAEDPLSIIQARLRALGADLDRVFLWPRDEDGDLPRLPADLERLDTVLAHTRPRLVVFDPLLALVDRHTSSGDETAIRALLEALSRRAAHYHATFLLLRHLTKTGSHRHSLYRGTGSIAFIAACRLASLAAPHPHLPARNVLVQTKNNFTPLMPAPIYSLDASDSTAPDAPDHPQPPLTWHDTCQMSLADLNTPGRPRLFRACAFLSDILKHAPQLTTVVHEAARRQGITKATLRRALANLEVRCQRTVRNGATTASYYLPHQTHMLTTGNPTLDAWLHSLPDPTPHATPGIFIPKQEQD